MEKKLILVGMSSKDTAFDFMNVVIDNVTKDRIDIVFIDHDAILFETPHTKVWFVYSVGQVIRRDDLEIDAIFGEAWGALLSRAKKGAVIASRDNIGLVDYICQVERENRINDAAKKGFINLVKSYVKVHDIPAYVECEYHNGTEYKLVLLHKYKHDTAIHVIWGEVVDLHACYAAVAGELKKWCDKPNCTDTLKGEPTMTEAEKDYIRRDIGTTTLAAVMREIQDRNRRRKLPEIKNVIFSGPATVVIWMDGTKTIVRCDNDTMDPEKGLAMAIAKKALGTNKSGSNYYDIFKQWLPKQEEPMVIDFATKAKPIDIEERDATCQE